MDRKLRRELEKMEMKNFSRIKINRVLRNKRGCCKCSPGTIQNRRGRSPSLLIITSSRNRS
jgi:hypothetical protein